MVLTAIRIVSTVCLLCWLGFVGVSDIRWRRIPNLSVLVGLALALIYVVVTGRLVCGVIGGAGLFSFYIVTKLSGGPVGGGDVKAAAPFGMVTGVGGVTMWFVTTLGALLSTVLVGCAARALSNSALSRQSLLFGRPDALPHGTSMALWTAGAVVSTWILG